MRVMGLVPRSARSPSGVRLEAGSTWRGAYAVLAAVHVAALLLLPAWPRGGGRQAGGSPPADAEHSSNWWAGPLAFFTYVTAELVVGLWAFVALTGDGLAPNVAALAVSAYWIGLTAGRLLLGVFGDRGQPQRVLWSCGGLAALATVGLAGGGGWAAGALPVMGLALAPMFPLLMQVTPERVGTSKAVAAIGWQAAAGAAGGIVGPAASGLVLGRAGTDAYGAVVIVASAAMLAGLAAVTRPHRA